jgi:hypothetical protein
MVEQVALVGLDVGRGDAGRVDDPALFEEVRERYEVVPATLDGGGGVAVGGQSGQVVRHGVAHDIHGMAWVV